MSNGRSVPLAVDYPHLVGKGRVIARAALECCLSHPTPWIGLYASGWIHAPP